MLGQRKPKIHPPSLVLTLRWGSGTLDFAVKFIY